MTQQSTAADPHDPTRVSAPHPGTYVRDTALAPKGISVTETAKLVGVSRPSMSQFLNGRVAATPDMAIRIERALGIPAAKILELQAIYDAAQRKYSTEIHDVKKYVPAFLELKATNIEQWSNKNISSRSRFAVFLRILSNSTGAALTKSEFPGNDDAETPGWDGFTEASQGTPWVPAGKSGWEFGTNAAPKTKADSDFKKSISAHSATERSEITFIFVTPKRWPGKKSWEAAAKASKSWKDVRAYDAVDLEQWVEQSLSAQAWLAGEINMPNTSVRSLDQCWSDWANVTSPPLSRKFFEYAIDKYKTVALNHLRDKPRSPLIVSADSTEEGLGFVSCLFNDEALIEFRDQTIVIDKPNIVPRLAMGAQTFIAITTIRDVERELASLSNSMHAVIISSRNIANSEPSIVLQPADYERFQAGLEEMNKERDEIDRLANASGRSLTVLRRRLSNVPAVRTPEWARDPNIARRLIPLMFVGKWSSTNPVDREGLSLLADRSYKTIEQDCQELGQLNDIPIISIGEFRVIISKIDALFAVAPFITRDELERYFSLAEIVLSEDDPSLDLDDRDRIYANIHGKTREFTGSFRNGVSETLVLLAVYGNELFLNRLGFNAEFHAATIVKKILPKPLTLRNIEANDQYLPVYAEAAPSVLLDIIEDDLQQPTPAILGLLRPIDSRLFSWRSSRTGLLWALEDLAWNPKTFFRSIIILARLSEVEINDNLSNKPINSLQSIFRSWMPQTSANHEQRLAAIKHLLDKFPRIGWQLCVKQFGENHGIGHYNHKPRWRTDGYGFGEPFKTWDPILSFQREMVELAFKFEPHSFDTLSDIVGKIESLGEEYQIDFWEIVSKWAQNAADADKAALREKIRTSTMSRRAIKLKKSTTSTSLKEAASRAYEALEPSDLLNRHAWLFHKSWVEESYDEMLADDMDFESRQRRIDALRITALKEIHADRGVPGIIQAAGNGGAAWQIGCLCSSSALTFDELIRFLRFLWSNKKENMNHSFVLQQLFSGALHNLDDTTREIIIPKIYQQCEDEEISRILIYAPFRRSTWVLVEKLTTEAQRIYWNEVAPDWGQRSDDETRDAMRKLYQSRRPRAAFACARFHLENTDARLLADILHSMIDDSIEQVDTHQIDQYHIVEALKFTSRSNDVSFEEKVSLEFSYLSLLSNHSERGKNNHISNLEIYIQKNPEFFIQAIVCAYRRNDDNLDPPEFTIKQEHMKRMSEQAYKLLGSVTRIPGYNEQGNLETSELMHWVQTVRSACSELARSDIGDQMIGQLLSYAPVGADGVWPCEEVREVLERVRSDHIMTGACIGRYNARGAVWRGPDGSEERKLASMYDRWAGAIQYTHPYVSSKLLTGMASSYEQDARREDTEGEIRRRLR